MCAGAKRHRVEVVETDQYGALLAGTAAAINQVPERLSSSRDGPLWRVKVNARHEDLPTRFATLTHELGHIYCGHLGADPGGRWPDRREKVRSNAQREMEAEAVCWLVCCRNGVKARSKEYLNSLIRDSDLGTVSMFSIYTAANRVESRSR